MSAHSSGRIITFYSYKGGTGRSMAVANVAWVLASNGWRVLTIDWDLEAPGLHRYYAPFLPDRNLTSSDGVIDFVIDYATETMTPPREGETIPQDWYVAHADILRYAASLDWEFPGNGTVDFVCAGRQGASYSTRVNTFDWRAFYERRGGGLFLEAMKARVRAEYDYVLIDSRTGASDTSGICTVQMPDDLVVCFTLNNQSIEGAAQVVTTVSEQRAKAGTPLRVFPVAMRVDPFEKDKLDARRQYALSKFALLPSHVADSERDTYWGQVEFSYVPFYAYEEILAVFGDRPSDPKSLLASARALTRYLTNDEVVDMPSLEDSVRQRILHEYAKTAGQHDPEDEVDRAAEQVFTRLGPDEQADTRRLFTGLVRIAPPEEGGPDTRVRLRIGELGPPHRALVRTFASAHLLAVGSDPKEPIVEIASDAVLHGWHRLQGWLTEDREFLMWRQELRRNMAQWEGASRDRGSLLSGKRLAVAQSWYGQRLHDLSDTERTYVLASVAAARRDRLKIAVGALVTLGLGLGVYSQLTIWKANRLKQARQYFAEAESLSATRRDDSAIAIYGRAIALDVANDKAYLGRGRVYERLARFRSALADYNSALRLDSSNATVYYARGGAHFATGQQDSALSDYSRAITLRPDYADAYFSRGSAYMSLSDTGRAIADFKKVLDVGTDAALVQAARERLTQLGTRPAVADSPMVTRVYVHYANSLDLPLVQTLLRTLAQRGLYALGPELRKEPTSGDVRYFFPGDSGPAELVRAAVEFGLAGQGIRQRFQLVRLSASAFPKAQRGMIEVWIPSLARLTPSQKKD